MIFAFDDAAALGLPTGTLNPVPVSAALAALFTRPATGDDRNGDGVPDVAGAPLAVELGSGQKLVLERMPAVNLTGATIEGIDPGKRWKIRTADKRQFFIEKAKDVSGADIYLVRGEARTSELAEQSVAFEVVGELKVVDPRTIDDADPDVWFSLAGGFYISLSTDSFQFFITADAQIPPLGMSGRLVGLLIVKFGATEGD